MLTFRQTPTSEFRQALNEGTLFDRSARVFEEAARTQRLYDVVVGEDQRIIGAGMLQDTFKEADGHHREEELGALMVHPAARGIGIVGLMIKLILVHRLAASGLGEGLRRAAAAAELCDRLPSRVTVVPSARLALRPFDALPPSQCRQHARSLTLRCWRREPDYPYSSLIET